VPGRQEIGVSGNSLHENAGKELTGEGQDPSPSIFFISLLGDRLDFFNEYRPWQTGQPLKYDHFFKATQ
jgi:hypothetical protein